MYLEKFRLDGRLAVITGGGGAIGLETARAFAEAGAKVIFPTAKRMPLPPPLPD